MKKIYFILFLFNISMLFAQEDILEIEKIAESEMKSASRTMEFQANSNTANYDVTYQELRFTVDPAVYNIAGQVTTTFLTPLFPKVSFSVSMFSRSKI